MVAVRCELLRMGEYFLSVLMALLFNFVVGPFNVGLRKTCNIGQMGVHLIHTYMIVKTRVVVRQSVGILKDDAHGIYWFVID